MHNPHARLLFKRFDGEGFVRAVALPVEQHLAGAIGKPREAGRQKSNADEIQDEADHGLPSLVAAGAGVAPSDDLSCWSIAAIAVSTA